MPEDFEEKIVTVAQSDELQKKGAEVIEVFIDKTTNQKMHKVRILKKKKDEKPS